ncbi:hypothetical protein QCA50_020079 [Cerrena zonata]|uniref:DUF7770 domain-containing protein n=1 Tax=Cerrena zonata TaxID=2478898 RepID=A0AAW0F9S0_9APHY
MPPIPARDSIVQTHLDDKDLACLVVKMRIIGIAVIPGNPPDSVYHFHVSLVFANQKSIRLNLNPYLLENSPIVTRGQLAVESESSPYPTEPHVISWECNLSAPLPAGRILDFILEDRKRYQYEFDRNGEGCRFWSEVILWDLIDLQAVDSIALSNFNAWEKEQKTKQGDRIPDPRPQGTFYE